MSQLTASDPAVCRTIGRVPFRLTSLAGGLLTALALSVAAVSPAIAFQQSPSLDDEVAAGSLPPVDDRLPASPYVEEMVDEIGSYGGTLRTAILASGDHYNLARTVANENLVRWDPAWTKIVPSIAASYIISDDATTYTFTLRKGMKWSDGAPFGVDDIMFWYEDVFMNEALTPAKNPVFLAGGKPVVVTKIDDDTVEFKFEAPYGLFIQQLAYVHGQLPVIYPKHYLSQFHEKFNADGIPALLQQSAAAADWVALFNSKSSLTFEPVFWQNLELPTLNPWLLTIPYADGDRVAVTRNPYYWKVDTDGNQLPYIDGIAWTKLDDPQLMALRTTSGDFDFVFRHVNTTTYRSVLFDGQEAGGYHFIDVTDLPANDAVIMLNLSVQDPVKREIFRNKDFRVALSHAINRQEIIDLMWVGQGTPSQVAPHSVHLLYDERMSQQYTKFDPARANALLEAIMPEKDGQGFRLGPDGRRFTINFMVADVFGQSFPDVMLMVQRYALDVGIDIQIRTTDRQRLYSMMSANEHEAYIWNCPGGLSDIYTDVRCYMPFTRADYFYASSWADWYADPATGEEPPEGVKAAMAAYDEVARAVTEEQREDLMRKFLSLSADNFLNIGITRPVPRYMVVSDRLGNVFEGITMAGSLLHLAPTLTQWYFTE